MELEISNKDFPNKSSLSSLDFDWNSISFFKLLSSCLALRYFSCLNTLILSIFDVKFFKADFFTAISKLSKFCIGVSSDFDFLVEWLINTPNLLKKNKFSSTEFFSTILKKFFMSKEVLTSFIPSVILFK